MPPSSRSCWKSVYLLLLLWRCEKGEEALPTPPPARAERSDGRPPSDGRAPRPPCKLWELIKQEWEQLSPATCALESLIRNRCLRCHAVMPQLAYTSECYVFCQGG
ncbi:unnamed protein product [Sphagnum jensenii]|uniref:Secreted protein n=1 Tax=Sphagnum jensenii TaxID=128206 RepID=A0ABP1B288_9BRYO